MTTLWGICTFQYSLQKSTCDETNIRSCMEELKELADNVADNFHADVYIQLRNYLAIHDPGFLTNDDLQFKSPIRGLGQTNSDHGESFHQNVWKVSCFSLLSCALEWIKRLFTYLTELLWSVFIFRNTSRKGLMMPNSQAAAMMRRTYMSEITTTFAILVADIVHFLSNQNNWGFVWNLKQQRWNMSHDPAQRTGDECKDIVTMYMLKVKWQLICKDLRGTMPALYPDHELIKN